MVQMSFRNWTSMLICWGRYSMSMANRMQDDVIRQIMDLAVKYRVQKVILFGSRARGDQSPVSDYDFAIYGESLSDVAKASFGADVEDMKTLKKIDILFVDAATPEKLLKNIAQEGVVIYE